MPVSIVFENLEDGMTIDEVMEQFPVTREQVKAVLEFAARSLDPETLVCCRCSSCWRTVLHAELPGFFQATLSQNVGNMTGMQ